MARIGIIGTGWGAYAQAPAFRAAGLDVTAICGRDPAKTRDAAERNDIAAWTTDWRELVARADVDLVSVITPPSAHLEMTVAALDAGKHVLCEKPTALDATEAQAMLEAARAHPDRITLIDHELRFLPSFAEARRRVREIGPVRYAEVRYSSPSRRSPDRAWNWWSDASQGGGILGAVGSHCVDALRTLVGNVVEARGTLETFIAERPHPDGGSRPVTADDFALAQLRFEGGALATLSFSVVAAIDESTEIIVQCADGALKLVGDKLFIASEKEWSPVVDGAGETLPGNSHGGSFGTATILLGRALGRALDAGERPELAPAATFEDGLSVQRVLDAIRRSSAADGGWEAP